MRSAGTSWSEGGAEGNESCAGTDWRAGRAEGPPCDAQGPGGSLAARRLTCYAQRQARALSCVTLSESELLDLRPTLAR